MLGQTTCTNKTILERYSWDFTQHAACEVIESGLTQAVPLLLKSGASPNEEGAHLDVFFGSKKDPLHFLCLRQILEIKSMLPVWTEPQWRSCFSHICTIWMLLEHVRLCKTFIRLNLSHGHVNCKKSPIWKMSMLWDLFWGLNNRFLEKSNEFRFAPHRRTFAHGPALLRVTRVVEMRVRLFSNKFPSVLVCVSNDLWF